MPDTRVLEPEGDLTLSAWINPRTADTGGGPFHFIVSKNYGGTGYAFLLIGSEDKVRLQFEANDTVGFPIPMHILANRWWHIAGTLQAGHQISLYLNGVLVAQRATNRYMQPNPLPLFIGTSPWNSFDGEIGDVQIWKVALDRAQIARIMSGSRVPGEPGLVAQWTFKSFSRGRSYDSTHHTRPAEILGQPRRVAIRRRPALPLSEPAIE